MMNNEKTNTEEMPSRFAFYSTVAWLGITVALWVLAFAPLPDPPVWLARARAVCFGTLPNGLPDTYGWVSLVMGPISMLGFLVVVWTAEIRANLRWMLARRWGAAAFLAFMTVPVAGSAWVGHRVAEAREATSGATAPFELVEPLPAGYPRGTDPAPPFQLIDQHGATTTLDALDGRPVILTFAFAHCTTICPVILETARKAFQALPGTDAAIVVITLDPWRDTPGSLPGLAESWRLEEMNGSVLSGEADDVLATLAAYNVPIVRDEKTGDIVHPALVYVIDRQGRLAYTFNGAPSEWLVDAVRRIG